MGNWNISHVFNVFSHATAMQGMNLRTDLITLFPKILYKRTLGDDAKNSQPVFWLISNLSMSGTNTRFASIIFIKFL